MIKFRNLITENSPDLRVKEFLLNRASVPAIICFFFCTLEVLKESLLCRSLKKGIIANTLKTWYE